MFAIRELLKALGQGEIKDKRFVIQVGVTGSRVRVEIRGKAFVIQVGDVGRWPV